MSKPIEGNTSEQECLERIVPDYALLFFDHLYSEYVALKPSITDPAITDSAVVQKNEELISLLDGIHAKRVICKLTWSDIYTFDLVLVHARPPESLIRKAYDARARYRSIAGQKEYDEYQASKPPNLTEIQFNPDAQPPEPSMIITRALRADLEYLLSKFYLYYAVLPVRENLRDELTRRAVRRTLMFVAVLLVLIFLNVGTVLIFNLGENVAGLTVLTVALAGIMGGCVSTLQRIQSAPSEGDALFNLASLNNGWRGLSLSPLYGGIFASLLFVLFAAGVLKGSAFPEIHTPTRGQWTSGGAPSPSPSASPTSSSTSSPISSPTAVSTASSPSPGIAATPSPASGATANPGGTNSNAAGSNAGTQSGKTEATPTPTPTPGPATTAPSDTGVLRIRTFLKETGPVDGVAYALLIVWSFIAGFAERLVPDTLNRLVAKNEAIQGS